MHTFHSPRRFRPVPHRGPFLPTPARGLSPEALARRQLVRFLVCAGLLFAVGGPVWSAGKAVVEEYQDEQVRRTPIAIEAAAPRIVAPTFSTFQRTPFNWSQFQSPSAMTDSPSTCANAPFLDGAPLELATGCQPGLGGGFVPLDGPKPGAFTAPRADRLVAAAVDATMAQAITTSEDSIQSSAVPEPSTWVLLTLGALGLAGFVRRRYAA